ncbi:MAG: hypothetical protein AAGD06_19695, partial [Acidobacteriota bacterium]
AFDPSDPDPILGDASARAEAWALGDISRVAPNLRPAKPPNPNDWRDPRVGWGLILAEPDGFSRQELIDAVDAPAPIRELLAKRPDAPVLRYRPQFEPKHRFTMLRDWKNGTDVALDGSPVGVAPGSLPQYLLIYGSPDQVPWDIQYDLNAWRHVGRLDLEGESLERYVRHLIDGWPDDGARAGEAVVWSVVANDRITPLMRDTVALPVHSKLDADIQITSTLFDGGVAPATHGVLRRALADRRPAFVLTTSHGCTGPLGQPAAMARDLGLPVDQGHDVLDVDELLGAWQPEGAIWYCHACCSAGSSADSDFDSLFDPAGRAGRILAGVAALGNQVAPLPRRLLGAKRPLRAFIGQVEPTFDWTLRRPGTRNNLTAPLETGLYDRLYQPDTVARSLEPWYGRLANLFSSRETQVKKFDEGEGDATLLLYQRLAAFDVRTTVILGDPTTMLPPLP